MWHSLSSHVERENLWFTVLMKVWVRCDWIKGRDSYKSMWLPVSMPGGIDSCGSKSPSWLRRWMDGWVKSKFTLIYVWNAKAEKNEKANLFPSFQVIDGDRYALSGRPPEVCSNFCLLISWRVSAAEPTNQAKSVGFNGANFTAPSTVEFPVNPMPLGII